MSRCKNTGIVGYEKHSLYQEINPFFKGRGLRYNTINSDGQLKYMIDH